MPSDAARFHVASSNLPTYHMTFMWPMWSQCHWWTRPRYVMPMSLMRASYSMRRTHLHLARGPGRQPDQQRGCEKRHRHEGHDLVGGEHDALALGQVVERLARGVGR